MRRALPALIATLGGLALLLNFHTAGTVGGRFVAAPTTSTTPAAGSSPPPSGGAKPDDDDPARAATARAGRSTGR